MLLLITMLLVRPGLSYFGCALCAVRWFQLNGGRQENKRNGQVWWHAWWISLDVVLLQWVPWDPYGQRLLKLLLGPLLEESLAASVGSSPCLGELGHCLLFTALVFRWPEHVAHCQGALCRAARFLGTVGFVRKTLHQDLISVVRAFWLELSSRRSPWSISGYRGAMQDAAKKLWPLQEVGRNKSMCGLLSSLIIMASWAFYPGLASELTR